MVAAIPDSHAALLTSTSFGSLATLNKDGSPQVTPIWFDWDGTHVLINTAKGRVKDRNMKRDGRVSISIPDPANPYRYLGIQGRIVSVTEQGADAHIDKMAKKYLNKDTYPWKSPTEVRVLFAIQPEKVHVMG